MGTIEGFLLGVITSSVISTTAPSTRALTFCAIGNAIWRAALELDVSHGSFLVASPAATHRWHAEALGSSAQIRCISLSCCRYRVMTRSASRAARIIQMLMRIRVAQQPRCSRRVRHAQHFDMKRQFITLLGGGHLPLLRQQVPNLETRFSRACFAARVLSGRFARDRALPLADLPQPSRGVGVLRLGARRPLLLVKEVRPGHICDVPRGGKPHKGFCALLRAACYRPEDGH